MEKADTHVAVGLLQRYSETPEVAVRDLCKMHRDMEYALAVMRRLAQENKALKISQAAMRDGRRPPIRTRKIDRLIASDPLSCMGSVGGFLRGSL